VRISIVPYPRKPQETESASYGSRIAIVLWR